MKLKLCLNVYSRGNWLSASEDVNRFERKFSKRFHKAHSVMVNSGSSANLVMIAALKKYYGWQDGDEIIVSCAGFPTTINPMIQNNLKPVFVDICWDGLNWDLNDVEKAITEKAAKKSDKYHVQCKRYFR